MRLLQGVVLLAGLSAAWPWDGVFEDATDKAVLGLEQVEKVFRRQENNNNNNNNGEATTTAARNTNARASATESNAADSTITESARLSASGTGGSSRGNATQSENPETIDLREPPVGVSMATPDIRSGAQYYKVGDWVTFGFNFTSVIATPVAVNVLASNSAANAEWTLAANMSYQPSIQILWDTNQYKNKNTPQLVMGTYTLRVENANQALATQVQAPGQLAAWQNFQFAMYTPAEYTPYDGFVCPTCNSGSTTRQTLTVVLGMFSITILSFTWFATGRFGGF